MSPNGLQSSIRRRNSMAAPTAPPRLDVLTKKQSSSFPNGHKASYPNVDDFELISLGSLTYTSLRDLLPSSPSVQSPTPSSVLFSFEIPIKNHLVKQAAWAYLQPMSTSPSSTGPHCFRRLWVRFSGEYLKTPVNACLGFINRRLIPSITRVLDWLLGAIRVRPSSRKQS